jgi:poly(3-hydroxybutyrate) depolymerase
MRLLLICAVAFVAAQAQQPQNPSPMVEHTRAHPRLTEQSPPGHREKLALGTLFLPVRMQTGKGAALLVFFHGGTWLPEVAAAQNKVAVVTVQAGSGSAVYARLFDDASRFPALLKEAESQAGIRFGRVMLGGWSAGCGAIRQILKAPDSYAQVDAALMIDGIHVLSTWGVLVCDPHRRIMEGNQTYQAQSTGVNWPLFPGSA